MHRDPVTLLTDSAFSSALAAALEQSGIAVQCIRDAAMAREQKRQVVVAPDWQGSAPPAPDWIVLPAGMSLAQQVAQVEAALRSAPTSWPSSRLEAGTSARERASSESLLGLSRALTDPFATVAPEADSLAGTQSTTSARQESRAGESAAREGTAASPAAGALDTLDVFGSNPGDTIPTWADAQTESVDFDEEAPDGAPIKDTVEEAPSQSGWLHGANTLDAAFQVEINPALATEMVHRDAKSDPKLIAGRYLRVGTLGRGGMGEVWSVRDRALQCVMAMKVIRPEVIGSKEVVTRFVSEAQATAQLQHPGIVPVHELGTLPDDRLFFTMQLVQGRTLRSVSRALHADSGALSRWGEGYGFSLRRLLAAMLQATQAVAYAHARGVLHRDLKPENIMLGDFGEVRVLDWGLARTQSTTGSPEVLAHDSDSLADLTPLESLGSGQTRMGQVAGTPAFMAPEQAWGRIDTLGPHTDVYALGACLYALLSGHPPHRGASRVALQSARSGHLPPLRPAFDVDPHLVALVESCLQPDWRHRPPHAGSLARQLSDWLDGARRRDLALAQVEEADARAAELRQLAEAKTVAKAALQDAKKVVVDHINEQIRQGTPSPAPLPTVQAQWAAEDTLATVQREEALAEVRTLQALRSALMQVPELPEAHTRLADHHRARYDEAEAREDTQAAIVQVALVREHDRADRHARWLADRGHLRLHCTTPGATARVLRCVEAERRLVPTPMPAPHDAPVAFPLELDLPSGSYVLEVGAPGHATVRYPALVPREGVWEAVPPEGGPPQPLVLPREGETPAGACHVPAGWAWVGGRGAARRRSTIPFQRVWIDAFWAEPHPVTNRRYLAFLDALVGAGREAEALAHVPRYRSKSGAPGAMVYGRRADGGFELVPDADGDLWHPDWPVVLVRWAGARAFAAWRAHETGWPWRLPSEHEWRKACGGVDGRLYPWGDAPVDHYANMRLGSPGPMLLEPVGSHPHDTSVYGVTGGAGGVMHWCRDPYLTTGTPVGPGGRSQPTLAAADAVHVCRGGCWTWATSDANLLMRNHGQPTLVREWWGFRLVCAPRAGGESG